MEDKKCSICGRPYIGFGNNAEPVNNGRCCGLCNDTVVTPRRLMDLDAKHKNEKPEELPEGYEMFEGKPMRVLNGDRQGWWRFHDHYDRDGYCDNPARGY